MTTAPLSLATDPSKINPAGASQEDLSEYQKSLDAQIKALEQRYANPNYFKVAAGFLKPQLGGFFASLGSASEALGENVELQRAAELPIAQMRSQLAQSKILTGQNKTVADMVAEYQASGKPLTPEFVAEVNRIAPDSPSAKALSAQLVAAQKQRELASSEQANAMQRVTLARTMGREPNPADLALIASASPTMPNQVTKPTATPAAEAPSTPAVNPEAMDRLQRDRASLENELKLLPSGPANAGRRDIIQSELDKVNAQLGGASEALSPPTATGKKSEYLPLTVAIPNMSDVTDPARQKIVADQTQARAQDFEKGSTERYNNLKTIAAPENLTIVRSATKNAISLMDERPDLAHKVLNLVRSSGPLAAAMDAGVSAQLNSSAGSFGGAIQFPVEAYLGAKLSAQEQQYADELLNSVATMRAHSMKMGGVSPTALVNHPAGLSLTQTINFDRSQTPSAFYNSARHFQMNVDFLNDYNAALNQEFGRVNPASLTRMTDAFNSPRLKEIADSYAKVREAYDAQYRRQAFKKKD
jgi:hypothetical protein